MYARIPIEGTSCALFILSQLIIYRIYAVFQKLRPTYIHFFAYIFKLFGVYRRQVCLYIYRFFRLISLIIRQSCLVCLLCIFVLVSLVYCALCCFYVSSMDISLFILPIVLHPWMCYTTGVLRDKAHKPGTPPDIAAHVHAVRLSRRQPRAATYTTRDGKKWQNLEKLIQRNALQHLAGYHGGKLNGRYHNTGDTSLVLCALQGVASLY